MVSNVMFMSKRVEWATPSYLFSKLNRLFHFTLDPCALPHNAKCAKYYTPHDDGLRQDWGGEIVFCNPPYGKHITEWVRKCSEESMKPDTVVVALLPARTDTRWFHDHIYNKVKAIHFVRGRLKFGGAKTSAPFPSMIVVF